MVSVVVGVSLPQGVTIRAGHMVDSVEASPMGPRTVKIWKQIGQPLTLAGNAGDLIKVDPRMPLAFGYRIHTLNGTEAETFLHWADEMQQAGDCDLINNNVIIWHEQSNHVEDKATELVDDGIKTGLEALDPENLPRELRGLPRSKNGTAEDQVIAPEPREPVPFMHHKTVERRVRRTKNASRNTNGNAKRNTK
jgi:hypothetical protein